MHNEGNCKQGEKAAFRIGENNNKWNNWQRINLQNIQAAQAAQYQKNKQPNQKVAKEVNRHFSKDIQMSNKHMRRYPILLIIREMQIKTTVKDLLMVVRMAIIKMSTNNKCWRGCWGKGILLHCRWECKLVQPLWRTVWRFHKKLKIELPYDSAIPLLCMYPKRAVIQKDTCTPQHY